jgi:hypothetical protein
MYRKSEGRMDRQKQKRRESQEAVKRRRSKQDAKSERKEDRSARREATGCAFTDTKRREEKKTGELYETRV